MVNNLENDSFVPRGLEIILYNHQEEGKWRECPNNIIAAEPLSWLKPREVVEENGSMTKRKRCAFVKLEVEKEKEFSLLELYKSDNIDEIILDKRKGGTNLDPKELLKNLKGWTVEKRKRQESNGKHRVDKIYRHPKSKRILRSLVEVKKFMEQNSYIEKAPDNHQGGSQEAMGQDSNIYLQLFQRLEETVARQTCNNYSKKDSLSYWSQQCETGRPSNANMIQEQERMNERSKEVQQSERSDSSKERPGCVGAPLRVPLDEIKAMVRSQVESQLAQQVAEKVSQYEKAQREMVERMESMHHLLALRGLLPPSQ